MHLSGVDEVLTVSAQYHMVQAQDNGHTLNYALAPIAPSLLLTNPPHPSFDTTLHK